MRKILFGCLAVCSTVLMSSSAFGKIALLPWHRACGKPDCGKDAAGNVIEPTQVDTSREYVCPTKAIRGLGRVPFCKHYPKDSSTGTVAGTIEQNPTPSGKDSSFKCFNPRGSQMLTDIQPWHYYSSGIPYNSTAMKPRGWKAPDPKSPICGMPNCLAPRRAMITEGNRYDCQ